VNWTRIFSTLAAFGVLLLGVLFFLDHGIHHWDWRPPIVATITLAITNLALALSAFTNVWRKRRRNSRHA
jgi:hypothetical protein